MMETVKKLTIWKKRTKMEKRQLCSVWAQRSELVRETASQVRGESRELPELKRKSSERTRLNNWPNIICWVWGGMRRGSGLKEGKEKYAEAQSLFWLHFPPQSSSPSLTSQPRTSWWATPLMGGMEVSPTAKIDLYSLPLLYMSVLMPLPYCFSYCSFTVHFEIRKCDASGFVIFSQDCFGCSQSFVVSYEF